MDGVAKCINCGEKVLGRSDKKYCSDQCRYIFNNKTKRGNEKSIIDINKILRKNRIILKQFNPEGKTTVRKEYLKKLDFDFKFHTHTYTTINGNTYKFCYEYGYFELDDGLKVLIINEQPYMKK